MNQQEMGCVKPRNSRPVNLEEALTIPNQIVFQMSREVTKESKASRVCDVTLL